MADRKLMEEYENSVMSLAVSEMLEKLGRELEEEYKDMEDIPPNPEASEKFYKALDKEYRKGQIRSFGKKAARFGRYAITVCAAVIVVFSISVVSVDALRLKFLDWLTNVHSTHTAYNSSQSINSVYPEYLPKGYVLQSYNYEGSLTTESFVNSSEDCITIIISPNNYVFNSDNEDTYSEKVEINDYTGIYSNKDNCSTLIWNSEEETYTITTNDSSITKETIVKIAQSLK